MPSIWSIEELLKVKYRIFVVYKTLKQVNNKPIECLLESRECVLPEAGHFFRHYEQINFAKKQLKLVKKIQRLNKNGYVIANSMVFVKKILIRCHEKLNLSVQRWWKDKMSGLQNIKCTPLGHTSRFHPIIMVPEISCETRFQLSREHSIYFYKRWTVFSFYITIKTALLRNCFEYAHVITKD